MTSSPQTILVASDFSDGSDEALAYAIELGKRTGAALEILHVVEVGSEPFPFGLTYCTEDRGSIIAYVDRALGRRADRARRAGLVCEARSVDGSAATEIVRRARAIGADLVVVGTHGRRGLAHALLGSVAERVVQHAACPVLTVPFAAHDVVDHAAPPSHATKHAS